MAVDRSAESLFAVVAYVEVGFAVAPPNREDASSPPPLIRSADSSRPFNSLNDARDCCCSEPPSPLGGRGRLLRPKLTILLFCWGIPCWWSLVVSTNRISIKQFSDAMVLTTVTAPNNDDSYAPVHAPLSLLAVLSSVTSRCSLWKFSLLFAFFALHLCFVHPVRTSVRHRTMRSFPTTTLHHSLPKRNPWIKKFPPPPRHFINTSPYTSQFKIQTNALVG